MTFEQIISILFSISPQSLIKMFALSLLLLHIAFSAVVVRQTKLMVKVIEAQIAPTIYLISFVHLLFSISVLIWTIIFL